MTKGALIGFQGLTFGHSLSVFLFGIAGITAQLTIRHLQLIQVSPGYLATITIPRSNE